MQKKKKKNSPKDTINYNFFIKKFYKGIRNKKKRKILIFTILCLKKYIK